MAFATVAELATHLQTTIAADKTAAAQLAVDLATGLIKGELGQQVNQATSTETLEPNYAKALLLSELPVTAVSSVVYDDTALITDDYTWNRAGILFRAQGFYWDKQTVVTYTHGYLDADVPIAIKAVCLSVAARYFDNPKGFDSKSGDNFTVSYFRSQGVLSDAERRMIRRYPFE